MDKVLKAIEAVTAEEREKKAQKSIVNKTIRAMVIGIPNVGKSSFVNHMANRNTAQVGNQPGVTKQKQWIRLKNNVELLDTPGVLWPKLDGEREALPFAFTGTMKAEILDEVEIAYHLLSFLQEKYPGNLQERYHFEGNIQTENLEILMEQMAKQRGAIMAGGRINEQKMAHQLLEDFRSGRLGKITIEKVEDLY